jgi:hypothetical protein
MTRKTVNLCFDLQGRLQLERFLLKSGAFFWRVFNCRKLVRFPRRLASFGPCTKLFVNLLSGANPTIFFIYSYNASVVVG